MKHEKWLTLLMQILSISDKDWMLWSLLANCCTTPIKDAFTVLKLSHWKQKIEYLMTVGTKTFTPKTSIYVDR